MFQINYNFCLNFLKFFFPPLFRANTFWKLFKIPRFLLLVLGNETNISNCDKRSTDQNERNDGNTIFFLSFFFFLSHIFFLSKNVIRMKTTASVCTYEKNSWSHRSESLLTQRPPYFCLEPMPSPPLMPRAANELDTIPAEGINFLCLRNDRWEKPCVCIYIFKNIDLFVSKSFQTSAARIIYLKK